MEQQSAMSVESIRKYFEIKETDYKVVPVRPFPEMVCDTVQEMIKGGLDIADIIQYARGAFDIFRASVNMGFDVPFIRTEGGVYEWPIPKTFTWDDTDKVILGGALVKGDDSKVRVVEGDNTQIITFSHRGMIQIVRSTTEIEQRVLSMGSTFLYRVPFLPDVGLEPIQMEWQQDLLREIVNPLSYLIREVRRGTSSLPDASGFILEVMEKAKRPRLANLIILNSSEIA